MPTVAPSRRYRATLAKVTASSIDEMWRPTLSRSSSKAVGVDDTAVTPKYAGPESGTRALHHRQDRARLPY